MTYLTCCVNSTYELISDLQDSAVDISYKTFRKYAEGLDEWAKSMGYEARSNQGLTLKNDFMVGYYKGVYSGKPCVFLTHSSIEYIWT